MIGLQRGTVKLSKYNPKWAELFEEEKKLLLEAFGDKIIQIEHIGSTAIPDVPAKPIIDINVGIESLDDIDVFIEKLPDLGYEYMPDRKFEDRHFFPKGLSSNRTHHLNLVEINSETWNNQLLFRDYLRSSKQARNEYEKLKIELEEKYSEDRGKYTKLKSDFIQKTLMNQKSSNIVPRP